MFQNIENCLVIDPKALPSCCSIQDSVSSNHSSVLVYFLIFSLLELSGFVSKVIQVVGVVLLLLLKILVLVVE